MTPYFFFFSLSLLFQLHGSTPLDKSKDILIASRNLLREGKDGKYQIVEVIDASAKDLNQSNDSVIYYLKGLPRHSNEKDNSSVQKEREVDNSTSLVTANSQIKLKILKAINDKLNEKLHLSESDNVHEIIRTENNNDPYIINMINKNINEEKLKPDVPQNSQDISYVPIYIPNKSPNPDKNNMKFIDPLKHLLHNEVGNSTLYLAEDSIEQLIHPSSNVRDAISSDEILIGSNEDLTQNQNVQELEEEMKKVQNDMNILNLPMEELILTHPGDEPVHDKNNSDNFDDRDIYNRLGLLPRGIVSEYNYSEIIKLSNGTANRKVVLQKKTYNIL